MRASTEHSATRSLLASARTRTSSPVQSCISPTLFCVSPGRARSLRCGRKSRAMATLADDLQAWLSQSRQRIGNLALEPRLEQVGHVAQVGDGVATVTGLPETRLDEL